MMPTRLTAVRRAGLAVLAAAPAVLFTSGANAQPAFDRCAAEAASQWEQGYESTGKDTAFIDTNAAITACKEALEQDPGNPQIKGWLGRAYYANGQKDLAVPLFEEATTDGNVVALALYGDMLISADNVEQDMVRGADMLKIAAEAGFAPAQNSLGLSFDFAEGVELDYAQAVRL